MEGDTGLRRLFSVFPGGRSGLGLLLLRALIGLAALFEGGFYVADHDTPTVWMWILGALALLSGAALVIGFLTPIFSVIVGLGSIGVTFSWVPAPAPNLLDAMLTAVMIVVVAAALVLLGPGALSVDARLFGLREIIIPRASGDLNVWRQ